MAKLLTKLIGHCPGLGYGRVYSAVARQIKSCDALFFHFRISASLAPIAVCACKVPRTNSHR